MRNAFWPAVLTLAMLVGVAMPRQMHLHVANGVRASHDAHHHGDPDEPLLHSHASPHHHEDPAPEQGEPEDVLGMLSGVLTVAPPYTPDPVVEAVQPVVPSPPVSVHRPPTIHQPPSHAPPPHAAFGSRSPPPAFS